MHDFERYREAARIVRNGWVQGALKSERARCGGQAVADAFGVDEPHDLPLHVQIELHTQLMRDPAYCKIRENDRRQRRTILLSIYAWNDAVDRRHEQVVKMLENLANRLELQYLKEAEMPDITSIIDRREREKLEDELEQEWHRLTAGVAAA